MHEDTWWRRLIGSPKLQIIFHKRATKYGSLLLKMTYKDKGSYESSPPCTCTHTCVRTCMNARKFKWKRGYMCICKCTRMYINVYSYLCQKCRYIYIRKCTNVNTCIFVNVQKCTCIYIRTCVKNVDTYIFVNVQVVSTTKCTDCIFLTPTLSLTRTHIPCPFPAPARLN